MDYASLRTNLRFSRGFIDFFRKSRHGLSVSGLQWEVIKRGLFIILISSTIASWLWSTILKDTVFTIYNAELWALGTGIIFVALVIRLPIASIATLSVALIVFSNALDYLDRESSSLAWSLWHAPKVFTISDGSLILNALYPIMPWLGIAGLGYVCAHALFSDTDQGRLEEKYRLRRRYGLVWSPLSASYLFLSYARRTFMATVIHSSIIPPTGSKPSCRFLT
jgi:uncharacterized membrane protein